MKNGHTHVSRLKVAWSFSLGPKFDFVFAWQLRMANNLSVINTLSFGCMKDFYYQHYDILVSVVMNCILIWIFWTIFCKVITKAFLDVCSRIYNELNV